MAQRPLPRYFLSRVGAQRSGDSSVAQPPTHVIDCFSVNNRHLDVQEWIVVTDSLGNLHTLPDANRSKLPAQVQTELAWHELAGFPKRQIEASEFFLFYVQLLEQLTEAPGLNDPVYLYGTLFGPHPMVSPAQGIEGQLTVTRADLLAGLIGDAAFAFRHANSGANKELPRRCFHLMLPADREEEIRQGRGIVLAYPLLPPELILNDVANEQFASQLLYDTISALKEDLADENFHHPLRNMILPVPSRYQLEQQLRAEGYEIKGNTAIKKAKATGGAKGLLASVFGAFLNDSLELPPEATLDEFLEIARLALNALPGWPTPCAMALKNLVRRVPIRSSAAPSPVEPPPVTAPTVRKAPPPTPQPIRQTSGQPADWMQDFMAAHHKSGAARPKVTSGLTASAPSNESEWMKDFAADALLTSKQIQDSNEHSSVIPHSNSPRRKAKNPAAKSSTPSGGQNDPADWMEDFE